MSRQLGRRDILRGLGGIGIALPFMPSLLSSARAAGTPRPPRMVFWMQEVGTFPAEWNPIGVGKSYQLRKILSPLEKYKSRMSMFSGIDNLSAFRQFNGAGSHPNGHVHALTANTSRVTQVICAGNTIRNPSAQQLQQVIDTCGGGDIYGEGQNPSIDQTIAAMMPSGGFGPTPVPSVMTGEINWPVVVYDAELNGKGWYGNSPAVIFERLFAGFSGDLKDRERLRFARKSVIDAVLPQLNSLQSKLSAGDKKRLDAHISAIRDVEIAVTVDRACTIPQKPSNDGDPGSQARSRLSLDLLAIAFACDMTRVATHYQAYYAAADEDLQDLNSNESDWHGHMSHTSPGDIHTGGTPNRRYSICTGWHRQAMREFAYFCDKLDAIDEGGSSVLDNSAVVRVSDMNAGLHTYKAAQGAWSRAELSHLPEHWSSWGVPYMYVGGLGGRLKVGEHFDFRSVHRHDSDSGKYSHGELLLTLARAMGVSESQLPTFGRADLCSSTISEILTGA